MTDSASPYVGGYYIRQLSQLVQQSLRNNLANAIAGQTGREIDAIVSERAGYARENNNMGSLRFPDSTGNVNSIEVHCSAPAHFACLRDTFSRMGFRVFFSQASGSQLTDALPEFIEQSGSGESRINAQKIPNGQTDFCFFLQVAPEKVADVTKALVAESVSYAKTDVDRAANQLKGADVKTLLGGNNVADKALRELIKELPGTSRSIS